MASAAASNFIDRFRIKQQENKFLGALSLGVAVVALIVLITALFGYPGFGDLTSGWLFFTFCFMAIMFLLAYVLYGGNFKSWGKDDSRGGGSAMTGATAATTTPPVAAPVATQYSGLAASGYNGAYSFHGNAPH
jgi:hypothetical protein